MDKLDIVIIIVTILMIGVCTNFYFMFFNNNLKAKPRVEMDTPLEYKCFDITREQAIEICESLVKVKYKLVYTDNLPSDTQGRANLFTHKITMSMRIQDNMYFIRVFLHELVHIKYYTGNERFVEFMTFKTLYESDNEIAHNVGIAMANEICTTEQLKSYDCSYYIMEYLK